MKFNKLRADNLVKPQAEAKGRVMRNKGWFWWLSIGVWLVLLFFIKRSFEFGGNPIFSFLLMLALFFLVLFIMRLAIFRARIWWFKLKRGLEVLRRHR